ncbi:MAG: hypothetical protein GX444_13615 [Myxococcales bacterium]|nr:hypothetical protein [Myxococcales bacterium]
MLVLLTLLIAGGAACVEVSVDPEPPYPPRDKDYSYPDEETVPPPWEDPEDYPYVTITSPVNGTFTTAGSLTVTGTYSGPELASLTLNGQALPAVAGAFSGTIAVDPDDAVVPIQVTATTLEDEIVSADRVTVFTGQGQAANSAVALSAALGLENRGLKAIGSTLGGLLDGRNLADLIMPEIDTAKAGPIDLTTAKLDGVEIVLQATADGLSVKLLATDLILEATLLGLPVNITAEGLMLDILADVTVDADHQVVIAVVDSQSSIASLSLSGILDEVASYLVGLVLDLLIKSQVPSLLGDLINGLDLTITSTGFDLTLAPVAAGTTDRDFSLALGSLLTITDPAAWNADFQPEGFRATTSDPVTFPEKTPVTEKPYGVAIGLNDDVLNQLLYTVAATGVLDFEVTDPILRAEVFSVLFFSFESIDPDLPLILRLSPAAAPLLVTDSETHRMYLVLPAYTGRVMVDRGPALGGEWEAMSFTVDLWAPLALQYNEDGSFSLALSDLMIDLNVVHNPVGQHNVDNMNRLFAEIFDSLLPDLLSGLTDMSISIPEILGLDISIADIAPFGPGEDYLGLFIDLQ